jgi:hypothetical protein
MELITNLGLNLYDANKRGKNPATITSHDLFTDGSGVPETFMRPSELAAS